MAHWAEIDKNNIVIRVVVTDNNDPNSDEGYQWLVNNLKGKWIQASYNGNIRKNFPGPGFIYDESRDAFITPKPLTEGTWVFNEETCQWYDEDFI